MQTATETISKKVYDIQVEETTLKTKFEMPTLKSIPRYIPKKQEVSTIQFKRLRKPSIEIAVQQQKEVRKEEDSDPNTKTYIRVNKSI